MHNEKEGIVKGAKDCFEGYCFENEVMKDLPL
jgi:hypothetical protein